MKPKNQKCEKCNNIGIYKDSITLQWKGCPLCEIKPIKLNKSDDWFKRETLLLGEEEENYWSKIYSQEKI